MIVVPVYLMENREKLGDHVTLIPAGTQDSPIKKQNDNNIMATDKKKRL